MKRHLFVGRFGLNDKINIPSNPDEQETSLQLVCGKKSLNYGINDALECLHRLGVFPSEVGLDLLVVAAHVYAADTRISRTEQSQDSWTREIRLVIPVSDPKLWQAVSGRLKQMLDFLTGDRWIIGFRSRPSQYANILSHSEKSLFPVFDTLSLFSGGLDSLIGTIDLLECGYKPLLISHANERATSSAQNKLFSNLKDSYKGSSFDRLRAWMEFPKDPVNSVQAESTTRGRSFLFFALGAFAGTGLESSFVLHVPENGLIALNVPLDLLRLGSCSTRTTHPFYMARWNDLLAELRINGRVENPYWNKTKGEMISACKNSILLHTYASDTLSCSSPLKQRWKKRNTEQCGYCLPCIIRRAALEKAWGPGKDPTFYTVNDFHAHPLSTNTEEGKQIRSFQVAIERLRRNPGLATLLIHKPGSLSDEVNRLDQLADVYRRGLEEVAQLIQDVKTTSS